VNIEDNIAKRLPHLVALIEVAVPVLGSKLLHVLEVLLIFSAEECAQVVNSLDKVLSHSFLSDLGPNLAKGDFLAKYVRSGAQSSGELAVMLAGTRYPALRAARKCAQSAYCEVLPAPEGHTRAKKQCNRAEMRGQTRQANLWCVLQHSWHRRSAPTWPKFGASLG
jgi:hypothetical protein